MSSVRATFVKAGDKPVILTGTAEQVYARAKELGADAVHLTVELYAPTDIDALANLLHLVKATLIHQTKFEDIGRNVLAEQMRKATATKAKENDGG